MIPQNVRKYQVIINVMNAFVRMVEGRERGAVYHVATIQCVEIH